MRACGNIRLASVPNARDAGLVVIRVKAEDPGAWSHVWGNVILDSLSTRERGAEGDGSRYMARVVVIGSKQGSEDWELPVWAVLLAGRT